MLRGWIAPNVRALQLFRTSRAKSTNSKPSPTAATAKSKPLPYSPHSRSRQLAASPTDTTTTGTYREVRRPWYRSFPDVGLGRFSLYVLNCFITLHLVTTYLVSVHPCAGPSMLLTINAAGDWIVISKLHAYMGWIKVGDLVSYRHPVRPGYKGVKRVIGMPGDFVLRDTPGEGEGVMVRVPPGHCWVAGDNLDGSRDSRMFGALPLPLLRGRVVAKITSPPKLFNDGLETPQNVDYGGVD